MHLLLLALLLLAAACTDSAGTVDPEGPGETPTDTTPAALPTLRPVEVAQGLRSPLYVTAPAGDSRIFVLEQNGRVRVVENGQLLPTPFLDLSPRVGTGGERGLLGLAFHPRYATNGLFFVNFTDREGDTQVERFRVSADRNRADPASAKRILSVDQPASNHNGGMMAFGPDGMLYIAMGDGGGSGASRHGQDLGTLLGDLLRIDVDGGDPYAVPRDNPYVGRAGARGEIWASGLRNPWRFSFDPEGRRLWVADVGETAWEEVNSVPLNQAGVNYGWGVMEGRHCYGSSTTCDQSGKTLPVHEYASNGGSCSVTGGYVYRGSRMPGLRGHYLYADFCEGRLRSFRLGADGQATDHRLWDLPALGRVSSFGEDSARELYVVSLDRGIVYRLEPQ